jgi:V/A-type H+-transporting ATPase subunit D
MADVPAWPGVETLGMGHVSTTRSELLARRARIGLAGQGRGILGERRAALMRESQRVSAAVLEAMRELERDAPSARRSTRSPHSAGS